MIGRRRALAPLVALVMLAGCGTALSGDGGSHGSITSPRSGCLSDRNRDATATSHPMVLFCVESP
jgi:hypothetical protein